MKREVNMFYHDKWITVVKYPAATVPKYLYPSHFEFQGVIVRLI